MTDLNEATIAQLRFMSRHETKACGSRRDAAFLDDAADRLFAAGVRIEALTARAEGAEARERAAVVAYCRAAALNFGAIAGGMPTEAMRNYSTDAAFRYDALARIFEAGDHLRTDDDALTGCADDQTFANVPVEALRDAIERGAHTAAQTEEG